MVAFVPPSPRRQQQQQQQQAAAAAFSPDWTELELDEAEPRRWRTTPEGAAFPKPYTDFRPKVCIASGEVSQAQIGEVSEQIGAYS
ncbi:hypothetical protein JRQ81_019680 [Phrynocephalus forsythii]|uniref:Uncharacterized protein n=1 Tax=Phrynocephalus forsythii TaxID=171643 RepID=A0A9Q1AY75_9SAUR|nr:hypothetical protein JRQ81_019680 [Phrynocephalus forsythii]